MEYGIKIAGEEYPVHSGKPLPELSERENLILRSIVHNFILTANPVGSRTLARRYNIELSPASIRNIMSDLEELGLLTHQHTSAGRIPTGRGYRKYVDELMQIQELPEEDRQIINNKITAQSTEVKDLLELVSGIMAEVSRLMAVIVAPDMFSGVLEKVEFIRVASGRIMIVIIINSGLVRTINVELTREITDADIQSACQLINQRLAGIRLVDIPNIIKERLSGGKPSQNALVRLFMEFPERIFTQESRTEISIGGTKHVLQQPEYCSAEKIRGIIELIEDRDIIVHLLKDRSQGVTVTIGEEHDGEQLRDFSVITSTYRIGGVLGTLGIIGPTRMNYSRLVSLVDYTAQAVSERASRDVSS